MTNFVSLLLLTGIFMQTNGQTTSPLDVPDKIKVPAGEQLVLALHAKGDQIYTCGETPDGKYGWVLKAPEAELRDDAGTVVIRHFAGPSWKHMDGSAVKGKAIASIDSPESFSIPWLLVLVTDHSGNGALTHVSHIQRVHTNGGRPPVASDCSASTKNIERSSSYLADYLFYAPSN